MTDLQIPILLDRYCAGFQCDDNKTCIRIGDVPACVAAEPECSDGTCLSTGDGGSG